MATTGVVAAGGGCDTSTTRQIRPLAQVEVTTGALDHVMGLDVTAYGHSFVAWEGRRSYVNRLAAELDWNLTNAAFGGDGSLDVAARVIGVDGPHQWKPGAAHLVLIDAATNDMFGSGLAGLPGYRNAMRAMLARISAEGIMDGDHVNYPGGQWWTEGGGDWHNGSAKLGGPTILLPGFGRAGKWAFGYAGIPASVSEGAKFDVLINGVKMGELDCHASCVPSPRGRTRGHSAALVDSSVPVQQITLERQSGSTGGGPWFDAYWKINEVSPPLIVLPKPVYSPATAYEGSLCTDDVVREYATALEEVAAEVGPNCLVVDTLAGWDSAVHMLPNDQMHPSPRGHAHIAAAIRSVLRSRSDWWPDY